MTSKMEDDNFTTKGNNSSQDMFADFDTDMSLDEDPGSQEGPSIKKRKNNEAETCWRGTALDDLNTDLILPKIVPYSSGEASSKNHRHYVCVKWPINHPDGKPIVPKPFPEIMNDIWDENHVRMPCSSKSQFPVTNADGLQEVTSRWMLIQKALSRKIKDSHELEACILEYNRSGRWNFDGLHEFFDTGISEEESEHFFQSLLPEIVQLALRLPHLIPGPIPLLKRGRNVSITLSQLQIASIIANSFFCTFPRRNAVGKRTEYCDFPAINFNRLYGVGIQPGKLMCIINYLRRVTTETPKGLVTFTRRFISPYSLPEWSSSTKNLSKLRITSKGTIEDDGRGMLQVDFANSYIGGGVIGRGCVQEEIRFLICPELICSMLFTQRLGDTECLVISGHERYSNYSGYAGSFKFDGDYKDDTCMTEDFANLGYRRKSRLVAIDALHFHNSKLQYSKENIVRELNKAFVGFSSQDEINSGASRPVCVATGNWGCGAFGGDPQLKSLIQIMAASQVDRDVCYFTFDDENLRDTIYDTYKILVDQKVTVGELFNAITNYQKDSETSFKPLPFCEYVKMAFMFNVSTEDEGEDMNNDLLEARRSEVKDLKTNLTLQEVKESLVDSDSSKTPSSKQKKMTEFFKPLNR